MQLRDYQIKCVNSVLREAKNGAMRQVIVLPTGCGKTVVFSQFPKIIKKMGKKTLILAHREELLEQAKNKLLAVSPEIKVGIEQGDKKIDADVDVVIASVPTIGRENSERIKKFNPDDFKMIIVDECHHSCSNSYINVFKYFKVYKGDADCRNNVLLLGVTATPNRSDHQGLDKVYDKITFSYSIKEAIEKNYLVNIEAFYVETKTDISKVKTLAGDFSDKELAEVLDNDDRNKLIVDSYLELASGTKALAFAVDVEHTKNLTDYFRSRGLRAEFVLGETDKDRRKDIIKNYSEGKLDVVVNCGVFTEGFDEPSIETILMARPTKSSVLFSQMVGRGLRLFENKDRLKLIDFVDNTGKHSVMSLPSLFGVPKSLKGVKGKFITNYLEKVEKIQEVNPDYPVETIEDWSDENIEKIIKKVDIFSQAQLPEVVKQYSKFTWEPYGDGFRIQFPADDSGQKDILRIERDMLGRFNLIKKTLIPSIPSHLNKYSKWASAGEILIGDYDTVQQAFNAGDNWTSDNKTNFITMFSQEGKWRNDAPSEAQLKALKRFKISVPKGLTKGQASVLLAKAFANKGHGKKRF